MSLLTDLRDLADRLDPAAKPVVDEVASLLGAVVATLEHHGIQVPTASDVPGTRPEGDRTVGSMVYDAAPAAPAEPAASEPASSTPPAPVLPGGDRPAAEPAEQLTEAIAAKQDEQQQLQEQQAATADPQEARDLEAQIAAKQDELQQLQIRLAGQQRTTHVSEP